MEAGVWPRPGRAEVARGSRARGSRARTRPRVRRPTCCEAAALESPQPTETPPSPRPNPLAGLRDAALSRRSLATPTSSPSPKPTNPGQAPTEPRWPRPPPSPAHGAPQGLRKGRGGGEGACACACQGGRRQRGRALLLPGRNVQAAELLPNAPPGGAKAREGGASGEQ